MIIPSSSITRVGYALGQFTSVVDRIYRDSIFRVRLHRSWKDQHGRMDPDFVRFAANVGSRMVESNALVAELTQQTPNEVSVKIKELEATPGYMSLGSDMTNERRSAITAELRELYQSVNTG